MATDPLEQITDLESYNVVVNRENQAAKIPTLIVITSSTPTSASVLSKIVKLSKEEDLKDLRFYEMHLTAKTTPMIKFGPQNCPIVILMRGVYCETLVGTRSMGEVEEKIKEMMERV